SLRPASISSSARLWAIRSGRASRSASCSRAFLCTTSSSPEPGTVVSEGANHRSELILQAMITLIDIEAKPRKRVLEGHVTEVLEPTEDGTRVRVAIQTVDPGKTYRIAPSNRTQVVYILEGQGAKVTRTDADG